MAGSRCLLLLLFLASVGVRAQTNRYVVFFKDKNGTPHDISLPLTFISAQSVQRRLDQSIAITTEDLPVNPSYVDQVVSAGGSKYFSSRWMNCLLVGADATTELPVIQGLSFVDRVELVAPGPGSGGGRLKKSKKWKSIQAEATSPQNAILGLDEMHADGFHGEGITIAILDSGYPGVNINAAFQHINNENRFKDSCNFIDPGSTVFGTDAHGAQVFSTIAGLVPGSFIGGAYKADYLLYITEDVPTEYRVEEYNWLFAVERADSAGADIISSSLGYNIFDDNSMNYSTQDLDGATAVVTIAAREASERGMVVVVSAGNEGDEAWQRVTPPADAQNILAVGSVNNSKVRSGFSSMGPTFDSRIKPDVMAMGSSASIILTSGNPGTGSGTSFSCPQIASLVAGVWQAFPNLSALQLIDLIKMSASGYFTPNNEYGYGIPHYRAIKNIVGFEVTADPVVVYPNPVEADTLTIQIKQPDGSLLSVTLSDQVGKQLLYVSYPAIWLNNPVNIDLSFLGPGVYFMDLNFGNYFKVIKLVKR